MNPEYQTRDRQRQSERDRELENLNADWIFVDT